MSKSKSIKNPFDLIMNHPSGLFMELIYLLTGLFIVFFIVWIFIRIHKYFSKTITLTKSQQTEISTKTD